MQVLCGLQVVFFLFNCQKPADKHCVFVLSSFYTERYNLSSSPQKFLFDIPFFPAYNESIQ